MFDFAKRPFKIALVGIGAVALSGLTPAPLPAEERYAAPSASPSAAIDANAAPESPLSPTQMSNDQDVLESLSVDDLYEVVSAEDWVRLPRRIESRLATRSIDFVRSVAITILDRRATTVALPDLPFSGLTLKPFDR